MILLHHGSQNAELNTKSDVHDLPKYSPRTVTRDKTAAAKIMEFLGDKAVAQAMDEEEQFIKNCGDKTVRARHSFDVACFAFGHHDAKIAYKYDFCAAIGKITGYGIESLLKEGFTLDPEKWSMKWVKQWSQN